jgi:hypothetical protein
MAPDHPKLVGVIKDRGWPNPQGFFPSFATAMLERHMRLQSDRSPLDEYMTSVVTWCQEQYGPQERWAMLGLDVVFRDGTDAVAFKLRWC